MANPHNTVANVISTVAATVFVEKFFKDKTVHSLKFAHVDNKIVSSIVTSLDLHKATGLWGAKVDKNPNTILTQNKIKSRLAEAKT